MKTSKYLCPVCFKQFSARKIDPEWPMCNDCGSEAMDIDVVPLQKYLAENTLKDLQDSVRRWREATGIVERYKQEKLARMLKVLELKRKFNSARSRKTPPSNRAAIKKKN